MKHLKQIGIAVATILVLTLGGLGLHHITASKEQYHTSTTPTFFFHGGGSSYHAEEYMTHSAARKGITNNIILANVHPSGQVTFRGKIKKHARNPIIEVNFIANSVWGHRNSWHIDGNYAYDAVSAAQKRWYFKTMNLVGHSMGNIAIIYLLLDHSKQHLPKLKKQVAIAGHFNGGIGFGYPTKAKVAANGHPSIEEWDFTEMKKLKKFYPKNAEVLNIYGDLLNGTHSDGDVPVNSAKTLKYIVLPRASYYHEKEFFGSMAQHSRLHHNPQVNKVLFNFLWHKK